jgi:hypothetical protein
VWTHLRRLESLVGHGGRVKQRPRVEK